MVRALVNLCLAILAILCFFAGSAMLLVYYLNRNDAVFSQLMEFVGQRGGTLPVLLAGITLFFLGLVLHFWSSFNAGESQHFHFNTDLGGVGITLSALEKFITKQAMALPMVKSVRPHITTSPDGKRLRLTLSTQIIATGSIKNVTTAVQEAVVNAIRDGLGLTEIETVDVNVTEIITPKGGLAVATPALTGEPVDAPLLGNPQAADTGWRHDSDTAETGDADEAHHPVS